MDFWSLLRTAIEESRTEKAGALRAGRGPDLDNRARGHLDALDFVEKTAVDLLKRLRKGEIAE